MDFLRFSQIVACWSVFVIACFCVWIAVNVIHFNTQMAEMFGADTSGPAPDYSKAFDQPQKHSDESGEGSRAFFTPPAGGRRVR